MSNLDPHPPEIAAPAGDRAAGSAGSGPVSILTPREVPLGGVRAMTVSRTLPQRARSLIGSWCFVDHYGPDPVAATGGMSVARHPHTGLATVSLLITGTIEHRDSTGCHAMVRPGELTLMVAGRGVSHQEFSTPDTDVLHGVQLWFALPESTRDMAPVVERYTPDPVTIEGAQLRVYLGSLAGSTSPVPTYTPPLLAAELTLAPGASIELDVDPTFEHGILLDAGELTVDSTPVERGQLAHVPSSATRLTLTAGDGEVRALLIGGVPLGEPIVMWWNFIGRNHAEIAAFRAAWQDEIDPAGAPSSSGEPGRFGPYPAGQPAPLPAPTLPTVQLLPRG